MITNYDRTTSGRGFIDQDHLEQFSVKPKNGSKDILDFMKVEITLV
jgi:hypothetical protein